MTILHKGYERKLTDGEICNPFDDVVRSVPNSLRSFRLGYTIKTGRLFGTFETSVTVGGPAELSLVGARRASVSRPTRPSVPSVSKPARSSSAGSPRLGEHRHALSPGRAEQKHLAADPIAEVDGGIHLAGFYDFRAWKFWSKKRTATAASSRALLVRPQEALSLACLTRSCQLEMAGLHHCRYNAHNRTLVQPNPRRGDICASQQVLAAGRRVVGRPTGGFRPSPLK